MLDLAYYVWSASMRVSGTEAEAEAAAQGVELEPKTYGGHNKELQDKLSCCAECVSNYEKEAQLLGSMPSCSWLRPQPQDSDDSPLKVSLLIHNTTFHL